LEVDLWEISLVTFPMLEGARVDAVKAFSTVIPAPAFAGAGYGGDPTLNANQVGFPHSRE
jgi:hypothetical protein